MRPRVVEADNAGPFTLDGTRTFVVGRRVVAVIDPGPDDPAHLDRVAGMVEGAERGAILLTHQHRDHSAGAPGLADRTGFPVVGPARGRDGGPGVPVDLEIGGGDGVEVDEGRLDAVSTPGHAREHLSYLHRPSGTLFAGDLLLGRGSTTWVGGYAGCVRDFLDSLDRVEALGPSVILPGHGPELERPREAIEDFRAHRLARIEQVADAAEKVGVREALADGAPIEEVVGRVLDAVYPPDLPEMAREGAWWSICAILDHLGIAAFPGEGPAEG